MKNLDIIVCKKKGPRYNMPYFTNEGWFMLFAVGMLGGVIGAVLFSLMMLPFTK